MKRISTIIFASDSMRRDALQWILRDPEIDVQHTFSAEYNAFQSIAQHHPQVVLIDLRQGYSSQVGIELIKYLREWSPESQCLALIAWCYDGGNGHRADRADGQQLEPVGASI